MKTWRQQIVQGKLSIKWLCCDNTPTTIHFLFHCYFHSCSNPLKDVLLKRFGRYSGPDGCIDDHVERKYFDNSTVRPHSLCHVTISITMSSGR